MKTLISTIATLTLISSTHVAKRFLVMPFCLGIYLPPPLPFQKTRNVHLMNYPELRTQNSEFYLT